MDDYLLKYTNNFQFYLLNIKFKYFKCIHNRNYDYNKI